VTLRDQIVEGVRQAFVATQDLAKEVTLEHPDTMDQVTEVITPGTEESAQVIAAGYHSQDVDGVNVQADDLKVLLEAAQINTTPGPDMRLVLDGATYAVVRVNDVAKLGVVFVVQARKPA
jgi:hypothetical protein